MPSPAILLESELAASTDALTQRTAAALAGKGWTVLVYDHAGFGNSGGPSHRLRWKQQGRELAQVWWWLRKRIGIDGNRVGIWSHGIGAWRARLLAEQNPDIKALVLQQPVWRQRNWLLQPAGGFTRLQEAGFFNGSEPDPIARPEWTLAWLELLRAPLPNPKRMPDVPVLLWKDASNKTSDAGQKADQYVAVGKPPRFEQFSMPPGVQRALTRHGESDPVLQETDAFFRQYL